MVCDGGFAYDTPKQLLTAAGCRRRGCYAIASTPPANLFVPVHGLALWLLTRGRYPRTSAFWSSVGSAQLCRVSPHVRTRKRPCASGRLTTRPPCSVAPSGLRAFTERGRAHCTGFFGSGPRPFCNTGQTSHALRLEFGGSRSALGPPGCLLSAVQLPWRSNCTNSPVWL